MELLSSFELYLPNGRFEPEAMLVNIRRLLHERQQQGFPLGRFIAHTDWALEDRPGVPDLAEYEARVDDLLSQHQDVVICVYDLSRFPATTIIDVIRSHPALIIGAKLHDNPFYTAPDQLVEELRQRGHA